MGKHKTISIIRRGHFCPDGIAINRYEEGVFVLAANEVVKLKGIKDGIMAVSYTHLDVYKRQGLYLFKTKQYTLV